MLDATTGRATCDAKLRNQRRHCTHPAGWGTDHVGRGRCKHHGGLSPIKHGRYSSVRSESLQSVLAELQLDPAPLDLLPDVLMLRALFVDFINRWEQVTAALLSWHASFGAKFRPTEAVVRAIERITDEWEIAIREREGDLSDEQRVLEDGARGFVTYFRAADDAERPRQMLDITDAHHLLAECGRLVERIEKIRNVNAISRPELNRVYQELWRAVEALVHDDRVKEQIRDAWLAIRL